MTKLHDIFCGSALPPLASEKCSGKKNNVLQPPPPDPERRPHTLSDTMPDGLIYKNSGGMDQHILQQTFREVSACRRAGILINTFMLAQDPYLVQFVQKVSEIARGKAYFTSTQTLGQYIMMDFMRRKRRKVS